MLVNVLVCRKSLALPITVSILTLFASGCAHTNRQIENSPPPAAIEQPQTTKISPPPASDIPAPVEVEIQPTAPQHYTVEKGDTLWDIASKYLEQPWYWPEIWHVNSQIRNPHLIYPGDVLTLFYIGGKPHIQVSGGPRVAGSASQRLTPQIRTEALDDENQTLPIQAIHQFMVRPRIVSEEEFSQAPYIVGSRDNRLIYGSGDLVYVGSLNEVSAGDRFSVYRKGDILRDPVTGEPLGLEAILLGDAEVIRPGIPTTVRLSALEREVLTGDRLLPHEDTDKDRMFVPHRPSQALHGSVISLFDAISQIGQYQVLVINLGQRDGIETGHVLAVSEEGRSVRNPYVQGAGGKSIKLPAERNGMLMVFRVFDKVSYGLVMGATRAISIGNIVSQP